MRLIDADELGASVIKNTVFDKGDVIKLIENAPTIEIIRCRECKHWLDGSGLCKHWSKLYGSVLTKPDDFCSYGSRSGKPNNSERSSE